MELWVNDVIDAACNLFPADSMLSHGFNLRALVALVMISILCGSIGSLVVGNRMAFFSDALAHASFAGVALGILLAFILRLPQEKLHQWIIPVMIAVGIAFGLAVFVIRERTSQASDTVIGVLFAGSIGIGAILLKVGSRYYHLPAEEFLFGSLATMRSWNLVLLFGLVCGTLLFLALTYNDLVLASFNTNLARSRRIPIRLHSALFIVLLAVIVNSCLEAVGALLINALLIVPAATAANVCTNMRQLFRWSIMLCLVAALLGLWFNWEFPIPLPNDEKTRLGEGGTIVVISVLFYFVSMALGPWLRERRQNSSQPSSPAVAAGR